MRYSVAVTTPAAANGAPFAQIRTAATDRCRIRRIYCANQASTNSDIAIYRSATTGTSSTAVLGQALDAADAASTVNVDTAWTVAPTIAATPIALRRAFLVNAGDWFDWVFPYDEEIMVAVSAGVVIWNAGGSAGSALRLTIDWEE